MKANRLNGTALEQMLRNGLANLKNNEKKINDMNVFPVSDGDTGRNMRLTLENGLSYAKSDPSIGAYLASLSKGMLLGARGNSGVILSQIFKGISLSLLRCNVINPGELRDALIKGYLVAYRAVANPVEGTILTVAREGIENVKGQIYGRITIEATLALYVAEMRRSLSRTPELLPVLKESNVVDSGAMGYLCIFEGMLKYSYGEIIEYSGSDEAAPTVAVSGLFDENCTFTVGYCMEFLLQLLKSKEQRPRFKMNDFRSSLCSFGSSVVVTGEDDIVKVHIHTFKPSPIIEYAQKFGEFISFKLENMQLQHSGVTETEEQAPEKELAIIAVASGSGVHALLKDMGVDCILESGYSDVSVGEFVDAIDSINAENILIYPNNKNAVTAAQQAAKMRKRKKVTVLESETVMQCYYSLAMDVPDGDLSSRVAALKRGIEGVTTIFVATAAKDREGKCLVGDKIAYRDHEIICAGKTLEEVAAKAACTLAGESGAAALIFGGRTVGEERGAAICEYIQEKCPSLEVTFMQGGQSIYELIIGII